MEILKGKKSEILTHAELMARAAPYAQIAVDVGTGDGKFVYQLARQHPDWFCIGLDAARENLTEHAAKIYKKPARGGVPNALYAIAAIENLPPELENCADSVTINFPWGSLLRGLVLAENAVLKALVKLAKPTATLTMLVNYNIFDDPVPLELRDLPAFTPETVDSIAPQYEAAGLVMIERGFVGEDSVKTIPSLWAKRVLLSQNPHTMRIIMRRISH